jgi:hypothetical protein
MNYPQHNPKAYQVDEHDIVTCPPDLWPLIREWRLNRQATALLQAPRSAQ